MEDFIDLSDSCNDEDQKELISQFKAVDDVDPPHDTHLEVLNRVFGHKTFRPMQWKIINSIINDRRDNCAIMATGYGKSLCYQFPSVYCGGVTVVISPLISLMEDQVLSLTISNIQACLLGTAQKRQKKVIEDILDNKYSLVYATPEFCCGDFGKQLLRDMDNKLNITLIAIDEAHCISSWGHDFRHQYRELATIRSVVPHVPILAVTATATPRVRKDIVASLKLRNPQIIYSGFDRPNLYLSVCLKGNNGIIPDLRTVMVRQDGDWTFAGPTIIYCITRKHTEQVADLLKSQGIECLTYHGGLTINQRKETHEKFVRDKVSVMVATIAFGMGIDKPDVRNIIHYGASRDIESYYQEVGRAGRDGQPATCTVFYGSADFEILRTLREYGYSTERTKQQKEAMTNLFLKYLETSGCRRQFILQHFEDTIDSKSQPSLNCCDNCTKKLKQKNEEYEEVDSNGLIDLTQYGHTFLTSIKIMGENRGLNSYILFIRGSKSSKVPEKYQHHPLHGSGKHKGEEWWKCIGRILERNKYLEKRTVNKPTFSYCTVHITEKGKIFLNDVEKNHNKGKILIEPPPDLRALLKRKVVAASYTSTTPSYIKLTKEGSTSKATSETKVHNDVVVETEEQKQERMTIYRKLLAKRTELAFALDCMPYMIASNEALMNLAHLKPRSLDKLKQSKLDGFTEAKIDKFGEEFINVIRLLCPPIERKSIKDILRMNPIEEIKCSPTMEITYNYYKMGKSIDEISKERNMVNSTIITHLVRYMKLGYPIKLKYFNISNKIKNTIANIVENLTAEDKKVFTLIKNQCPLEITFDQIKVVLTYLEIRNHLKQLDCEYEEFDDTEDESTETKAYQKPADQPGVVSLQSNDCIEIDDKENVSYSKDIAADADDAALSALVDEIENGGYFNEAIAFGDNVSSRVQDTPPATEPKIGNIEPPRKKQKLKISLDSPPRISSSTVF